MVESGRNRKSLGRAAFEMVDADTRYAELRTLFALVQWQLCAAQSVQSR